MNVKDLQHSYEITADVPGVPEENLKVEIPSPGILRISGKRSSRKEEKSEDYFHVETESGSFQRTFNIPSTLKVYTNRQRFIFFIDLFFFFQRPLTSKRTWTMEFSPSLCQKVETTTTDRTL